MTWAARHLLPGLEVTTPVPSITVHPTCSVQNLGLGADLTATTAAITDTVHVHLRRPGRPDLTARILVVEEGGVAFPRGSGIGAPDDDVTGKWCGILDGAGFEPGMYSWWNAVPCGLDRPLTAEDKVKARGFLSRAIALHAQLYVVIAVGSVAQEVAKATRTSIKLLTTRSPLRSSNAERKRISDTFIQARLDAYPVGLDPDR